MRYQSSTVKCSELNTRHRCAAILYLLPLCIHFPSRTAIRSLLLAIAISNPGSVIRLVMPSSRVVAARRKQMLVPPLSANGCSAGSRRGCIVSQPRSWSRLTTNDVERVEDMTLVIIHARSVCEAAQSRHCVKSVRRVVAGQPAIASRGYVFPLARLNTAQVHCHML